MTGRRGSNFGRIDVGDTQGASVGTSEMVDSYLRNRRPSHPVDEQVSASPEKPALPAAAQDTKNRSGYLSSAGPISWQAPLSVLLTVYGYYVFVTGCDPEHWLSACLTLSYRVPGTHDPVMYGKGKRDIAFVAFHVIWFAFLREFVMQVFCKSLARSLGVTSRHKVNRFIEQAYSMFYYGITGPLGLYIMYRSDYCNLWYFRTRGFYEGFPHKAHDVWFKAFYLLQAAFWAQQALVLVLALEKRRKDFHELVFHHIVTLALIICSYRFHFTYMGLAIYITMDVSDFFLALSKLLNYLDSPWTPPFFFLFVATWVYLRHYVNLVVLWSVLTEFRTIGPFELNWDTQQYKCWLSQYITFALLFALQLVNFYWLVLILRIAYRYLRHNVKEDVRSDAEDSE